MLLDFRLPRLPVLVGEGDGGKSFDILRGKVGKVRELVVLRLLDLGDNVYHGNLPARVKVVYQ
jgi:hypothetical protein